MYTVNASCNDNLTLPVSCITMGIVPYGSVEYDILARNGTINNESLQSCYGVYSEQL